MQPVALFSTFFLQFTNAIVGHGELITFKCNFYKNCYFKENGRYDLDEKIFLYMMFSNFNWVFVKDYKN